jgi:hypothetical protein
LLGAQAVCCVCAACSISVGPGELRPSFDLIAAKERTVARRFLPERLAEKPGSAPFGLMG